MSNQLGAGVTPEALTEAIEKSGYPLQSTVFNLLESDFTVQQEWGFNDRLTGEMRSCDLLAIKELGHLPAKESRIRPSLAVVIECKQSDLPYVFFSPAKRSWRLTLPQITGLRHEHIAVRTDDSKSSWLLTVMQALEIDNDPFLNRGGFSIMSKCARKPKLELTGTDAYNGIVMPLLSAAAHFAKSSEPRETWQWLDAFLLSAVAVLDAPMVAARTTEAGTELELTPWCRLFRHEPETQDAFVPHVGRTAAIDVVHKGFFRDYLLDHLIPFAEKVSTRILRHNEIFATGKGFAPGMDKNSRERIYERLRPTE
ncbi:hypothetical protein [Streptomyces alkaliterrae]|uniref:Uncharacterized protein n=1 Tax=Streptomyces alkaliterrae TaxID=2213162 RepID=A0A5P0YNE8_9ACTN|nr:hypothetical protein [Streptomyces alkaliterrae]MBB1259386.1 hypothetical protein [Streptomyces alkaliterrae]MQS01765.1 hypothetical protein [Streptomyces alkaliterrae]